MNEWLRYWIGNDYHTKWWYKVFSRKVDYHKEWWYKIFSGRGE